MHQRVVGALVTALNAQLSADWEAVPDVAITSADAMGRGEAVPRGAATELGRSVPCR